MANPSKAQIIQANGDATGTTSFQTVSGDVAASLVTLGQFTVTGIQGNAVPAPTGTNTVLTWSGSAFSWGAGGGGGPSVTGSGFWHSTSGALDAAASHGTAGQFALTNSGATDIAWTSLSGDVSASTGTPGQITVTGIQTHAVPAPTGTGTVLTWSGSSFSWASGGSGVTWANDLATSSNTHQWVSGISGPNGTGGNVTLGDGVHSLSLTGVTSLQATSPTLSIIGSQGQNVVSGTNNNGGNIVFETGAPGTGGSGGIAGGFTFSYAGTTAATLSPSNTGLVLFVTSLLWDSSVTTPTITQIFPLGTGSNAGQPLTIQSQRGQNVASGTNNNGGNLILESGLAGAGGTGGQSGDIQLIANSIDVTAGAISWTPSSNALVTQATLPGTGPVPGRPLTIAAQAGQNVASGTNTTGGDLQLFSGTAGSGGSGGLPGNVVLGAGGGTFATTFSTTSVTFKVPTLQWASSVSTPTLFQATLPGTGANAGQPLTIEAQAGQNVASGTNNNGGNIVIQSGSAGSGGTFGTGVAGNIEFVTGPISTMTPTTFTLGMAEFGWVPTRSTPTITQRAQPGTGGNFGFALTIAAQNGQNVSGGTNNDGGSLFLFAGGPGGGGTGGNNGSVFITSGILALVVNPNDVTIEEQTFQWSATSGGPLITQLAHPGTGSTVSSSFTLQAQNGQNVASGTNNNGGNLILGAGAAGTGGTGGHSGDVQIFGNNINLNATTSVTFSGAVVFNGNIDFASTVASPTITQIQPPGTGSTAGQALLIQAQQGQAVASGTNNNGGNLVLASGAVGGGGTGGINGNVIINSAGGGVVTFSSNTITLDQGTLAWVANTTGSSPTLTQAQLSGTGSGVGTALTIQAQQGQNVASGTNNNGGNLILASGSAGVGGSGGSSGNIQLFSGTGLVTIATTTVTLNQGTFEWAGNVSNPTITQLILAGTGAHAGQNLSITAQQGQAVASGTNNSGGDLLLSSGAVGTGGSGGSSGRILLQLGGAAPSITVQSGNITLGEPLLEWGSGVASPTITQVQPPGTGSTGGQSLLIQAQQGQAVASGTNNNGGNLVLASGAIGGGGSGGVNGTVIINSAGGGVVTFAATTITLDQGTIQWPINTSGSSPTITQLQPTGTGSRAGTALSIIAQQGQNVLTGSNNAGGNLILAGGLSGTGGIPATSQTGDIQLFSGSVEWVFSHLGVFTIPNISLTSNTPPSSGVYLLSQNSGTLTTFASGGMFTEIAPTGTGTANTQTQQLLRRSQVTRTASVSTFTLWTSPAFANSTSAVIEVVALAKDVTTISNPFSTRLASMVYTTGGSTTILSTDIIYQLNNVGSLTCGWLASGNVVTLFVTQSSTDTFDWQVDVYVNYN